MLPNRSLTLPEFLDSRNSTQHWSLPQFVHSILHLPIQSAMTSLSVGRSFSPSPHSNPPSCSVVADSSTPSNSFLSAAPQFLIPWGGGGQLSGEESSHPNQIATHFESERYTNLQRVTTCVMLPLVKMRFSNFALPVKSTLSDSGCLASCLIFDVGFPVNDARFRPVVKFAFRQCWLLASLVLRTFKLSISAGRTTPSPPNNLRIRVPP